MTKHSVASAMNDAEIILAMEQAALDRWSKGDPSGFLEITDPEVTYFDNIVDKRVDGLPELTALYDTVRGKIHLDRYEQLNPKVQLCGEAAVLTYNFIGHAGGGTYPWNCTEVYRRTAGKWRILQTHWSVTRHSM